MGFFKCYLLLFQCFAIAPNFCFLFERTVLSLEYTNQLIDVFQVEMFQFKQSLQVEIEAKDDVLRDFSSTSKLTLRISDTMFQLLESGKGSYRRKRKTTFLTFACSFENVEKESLVYRQFHLKFRNG